jgi:hypothetical protein
MSLTEISAETIAKLTESTTYPVPEQHGPLRYYDKEMRCASRGCSSPTHWMLQGVPKCWIHCMNQMNDMLAELGF